MKKKIIIFSIFFTLMIGMITGCGVGDKKTSTEPTNTKPIVLTYAFFAPAGTFPALQMEKWAEEVVKRTNGKVKVDTFPGGTLLTANNMYIGVLEGAADIGLSSPTYEPGRFPLLAIADLPLSYPNAKIPSLIYWELTQEFQPESLAEYKVITMFTTEPAYIQSIKPVRNLDDLRGLELRATGTIGQALQALGAAPIGMSMAEVGGSLQTQVIKGYVSSREVLKDFMFAERVKYVTDYPLGQVSFAAVMTKEKWNSLPPDVQKVIDELSVEMTVWASEYLDSHVKEVMNWASKEHGVQVITLTPEEKAKWDEKLIPLQNKIVGEAEAKGLPGQQFIERLFELREDYINKYQ